ncbi:MAG: hypothetical protein GC136_01715 [Alphaproteobacteria bacterium]|nr:hypothetical protein [Alphaproteobacteria bacterium]
MLPRKRFFLIRHGESEANLQGIASGHVDTPLTAQGRLQAETARNILKCIADKPIYIVHSALSRARDTATIINTDMGLPMHEIASLNERHFGDWQGLPWKDVRQWRDEGQTPQNGESRDDFYARAHAGTKAALAHRDGTALIVTHGGVFNALWEYLNMGKVSAHNCALYEISPQGETGWIFTLHEAA